MTGPEFDLAALASLCTPDWLSQDGAAGLFVGLFLAGLTGSLLHCGPMCGGFVMAQVGQRMALAPAGGLCERARLAHAALPGYHAGRIVTYAALGLAAGSGGALIASTSMLRWATAALLGVGAILLMIQALRISGVPLDGTAIARLMRAPTGVIARVASPFFDRPLGLDGLRLGLMLGLMPCGLVYAALSVAAATGKPLAGALAMLAFGLGTVPLLVAIGLLGHLAGRRFQALGRRFAPVLLGLTALLLTLAAYRSVVSFSLL